MALSYDKASNTATVTFKVPLRSGNWTFHIWAGGVWNADYTKNLDGDNDGRPEGDFKFRFTA